MPTMDDEDFGPSQPQIDSSPAAGDQSDVTEQFDDDPGIQPYPPDEVPTDREVVTTPYDPPVKSLLADIRSKELIVNPEFQRRDVWDRVRKSRLIESLLLNIPVPVLFLAEDDDGSKVVVDGQQRLRSVEQFEAGQFALTGLQVLDALNTKRWADLTPRQGRIILNRTLRCIVISATSDPNLRFEVFERLNTGGVSLNDQELRNSIYRGPFNGLLNDLAKAPAWLSLLNRKEPDNRLQHHEMILRFFASLDRLQSYKPPLKQWVNDYMKDKRYSVDEELQRLRAEFFRAVRGVDAVFTTAKVPPFRRARLATDESGDLVWDKSMNRPIFELQMLGLMDEDPGTLADRAMEVVSAFAELSITDEAFADAVSRATADRTRTRLRIERWGKVLDGLGIANRVADLTPADS